MSKTRLWAKSKRFLWKPVKLVLCDHDGHLDFSGCRQVFYSWLWWCVLVTEEVED